MLYEISIGGEFQNVKGIAAEQTFHVLPNCTFCNTDHVKHVVVSSESERRDDDTGKFNLIVSCGFCQRKMKIKVIVPKRVGIECIDSQTRKLGVVEMHLAEERSGAFVVSKLHTTGCRLSSVKLPAIDVLSTENVLFKDVSIEESSWAGTFGSESVSSIAMLRLFLSETK